MNRVMFLLEHRIVQIVLVSVSLVMLLSGLVYFFLAPVYFSDDTVQHTLVQQVQKGERQRANREISSPNGIVLISENMTDTQVKKAIHLLSHQKVRAAEKWGAEEITQEKSIY
jgi:capsular polysaccharide biosynthesis protein